MRRLCVQACRQLTVDPGALSPPTGPEVAGVSRGLSGRRLSLLATDRSWHYRNSGAVPPQHGGPPRPGITRLA